MKQSTSLCRGGGADNIFDLSESWPPIRPNKNLL